MTRKKLPKPYQKTRIILHCSGTRDSKTVSWQAIRRYHRELGWFDIGYHFGIEKINNEYEILAGRPINEEGAHCRDYGMNRDSIGFCFIGNFDETTPEEDMLVLASKYIYGLCNTLEISIEDVYGHKAFSHSKTCPGIFFDIDDFKSRLLELREYESF